MDQTQEVDDTLLSQEIEAQSQGSHGSIGVGMDTLSKGQQTLITDTVMTELNELESCVYGQGLSKHLGTIKTDLVVEDVESLEGSVLDQHLP